MSALRPGRRGATRRLLGAVAAIVLASAFAAFTLAAAHIAGAFLATVGSPGPRLLAVWLAVAASASFLLLWPVWRYWRSWVLPVLVLAPWGVALFGVFAFSRSARTLRTTSARQLDPAAQRAALSQLPALPPILSVGALASTSVALCPRPLDAQVTTLVAHYSLAAKGGSGATSGATVCIQKDSLSSAVESMRQRLRQDRARFPVKLDVVLGVRKWSQSSFLDPLLLHPGLDGVCSGRACLLPWQLLTRSHFSRHRPWPVVPDLQFGVAPEALRRALGAPSAPDLKGLTRFETSSFLLTEKGPISQLRRMRLQELSADTRQLRQMERRAQRHLMAAQLPDGRFRYALEPFTGERDLTGFNLARHAGAALVLCELGKEGRSLEPVVRKALRVLPRYRRLLRQGAALSLEQSGAHRLAENALPLVALLACRRHVGEEFDSLLEELASFLIGLQRPDGGFAESLEAKSSGATTSEPLYAPGQAVFALVLLEQLLNDGFPSTLDPERVTAAVTGAMRFYGLRYFRHPLRDFFFIEENWHCLAARAAVSSHRSPHYEKLCLDYVASKARFILRADAGAAASFDGGFGFGNWIPPHSSGTAGFVEALAAALSLLPLDSEPTRSHAETLRRALRFIGRQQWTDVTCFACATDEALGAFSEHIHSSRIRIDYVQHAWAALGHGRRWLERYEHEHSAHAEPASSL